MEVKRGGYGAGAQETGYPRENPPTSGIVGHDSHMRKSGSDPAWNRTKFAYAGGEMLWSPPGDHLIKRQGSSARFRSGPQRATDHAN
ncbi:hypothetical protein PR048_005582 [Dryococelus australis]|uniref:Uncharacterized protein n=1 Tax=Dryococelus australis TaxID=614101 RepID=A0ABQ9I9J1_9NEOP|nr:hypothetical protein PR048_005582 [Dryococelus australis]